MNDWYPDDRGSWKPYRDNRSPWERPNYGDRRVAVLIVLVILICFAGLVLV